MHPRISINTISTLTWPLGDDLAMLERLDAPRFGFPLLKIEDDPAAGVAAIRASGRAVSCLAASTTSINMMDGEEAMAALAPAIDIAADLGCPLCYFTSGTTPPGMTTDEALERLAGALPPASAYARSRGVRLAVENNSMTNRSIGYVHTLPDAIRLAEAADIDICLELQNCWYEGGLSQFFHDHVGRIGIVQVSDFRVGEELRLNRRVPGDGSMPLAWMIGELLRAGYAGLFDIEIIGPSIDAEGAETALRRSADWLSAQLRENNA